MNDHQKYIITQCGFVENRDNVPGSFIKEWKEFKRTRTPIRIFREDDDSFYELTDILEDTLFWTKTDYMKKAIHKD